MTTVLERSTPGASDPAVAAARGLPGGRRTRKPLVLVVSIAVVFASIAGFASLYSASNHQQAVLIVTGTIQQGQLITAEMLGQADVAVSGGIVPIPVGQASELAGRRAAVTIPAGSLLVASDVTGAPRIPAGDAVVGLALKPGQLPSNGVQPGDQVMIVQTDSPGTPLTGSTAAAPSGSGSASASDSASGSGILVSQAVVFETATPAAAASGDASELVSVEVSSTLAAAVSTASAADQVSLVLLPPQSGSGSGPAQ